ncbi:MFS transporter [Terriglobus tenax]|uniref:MFS transporter n=1 Tax=Terriglobus tenax TaxID=1111115 RepID=UPI0021E0E27C|nr:MFS transporter [Terriglobus tenax]
MRKPSDFPWFTIGLLFTATALSFLDRQVLSILAPRILSEFDITNTSYSHVLFAFQLSYTIMSALGGYMIDRIGVKKGLAISLALWSAASAAHAWVRGVAGLSAARFVLGIGEGACFPAATRGAASYAPASSRSLATGIAIGGSALGAVIAPPLTVLLAARYGWRGAFLATGIVGGLWCVLWMAGVRSTPRTAALSQSVRYVDLLRNRRLQWVLAARFVFDPVFYFYMFWIPQFLSRERGLSLDSIGKLFWIPFLTLGISQVFSGSVTDWFVGRRGTPVKVKTRMLLLAAALTPVSLVAGTSTNIGLAIFYMSVLLFAHGIWITNYLSLVADIFPAERNASVVGLTGMVGGFAGMLSTLVIGPTVDRYTFLPVFIVSGFIYPAAYLLVRQAVRTEDPLPGLVHHPVQHDPSL